MGEIPIKNKKCLQVWEYGFIILKIVLWAHFTITHAVLRESTNFLKTTYSGTPYYESLKPNIDNLQSMSRVGSACSNVQLTGHPNLYTYI